MKTRPGNCSNVGNVANSGSVANSANAGMVSGNTSPAVLACNRNRRRPLPSTPTPQPSTLDCQTPPPSDREITHGKFAGISPESIQCISEQVSIEHISEEACSILAEDVSYKLRQLINNVALYARNTKTQRVEVDDINEVLKVMDSEPVLGAPIPQWVPIVESEHLCTTYDPVVDLVGIATQHCEVMTVPYPSLSASWIIDSKNATAENSISPNLQNYYTKIAKALLSNNKQLIKVALQDISTNTHIGPIVPYLINLSLLVLNELVTVEIWLKRALKILTYLLINPCCSDTDVTLQLQRLFPLLVSNILTGNVLSEEMLRVMLSIVTVWPQLAHLGRNITLEYLSQRVEERLNGPLVECLTALGRKALVDGLTPHMSLIEAMTCNKEDKIYCVGLQEAMLEASYTYLKAPDKYEPKVAYIDECLYEILGDSIIPRRIHRNLADIYYVPKNESDPYSDSPSKYKRKTKIKILKYFPSEKENKFMHNYFDMSNDVKKLNIFPKRIQFNVVDFRQYHIPQKVKSEFEPMYSNSFQNGNKYNVDRKLKVTIANGLLLRFKYKLPYKRKFPTNYTNYLL